METLLAVDGNSLVHRSFHALAGSDLRTADDRPIWAVKGFCSQVLGALDRVGARALVVGFDDHTASERKTRWPHYKATRKPKPPELGDQIARTIELLRAAGVQVVVPAGLEADDVLASAARTAAAAGWQTVILTSDRDSFALIDETTTVLRLINGGVHASPMLSPDRLVTLTGVRPEQYREYAAMRGDTSDNLTGINGIGEKTAARLLAAFGTVQAAFDDVDAGGAAVAAALGRACVAKLADAEHRAAFARNVEIMTMRTDLALGLDLAGGGSGCLPLDPDSVSGALEEFELAGIRMLALRLLADAPDPEPALVARQPADRNHTPRVPAAVAAPAPGPQWVGDTLF
ncbi:MAG TPA: 5'-3' exonuclease H3TH domain-containing protein [Mycobacteriales bacterium]|nr:5'-3' exonuclease H3TH domain-containing protein [Mycobacteriales bacterium]